MRMKVTSRIDYRKKISDLIESCFIQSPDDYNFTSDMAFAFLNRHANNISNNYGQIVFILGTIFNVKDEAFSGWFTKFNGYLSSNKELLLKMEHCVGYERVYLTDKSKLIFCYYIDGLNKLVGELSNLCSKALSIIKRKPIEKNVFIVHGHDTNLRDALKKSLIKYGFNPIVLSDMNDSGISLFDKFEKYANTCTKAVVLMTADDLIAKKQEEYYQGRPNVLIEYGYFLCMINKSDIVVLLEKGCKKPSDVDGVSYIEYNGNAKQIIPKVIDSLNLH